MTFMHAEYRIHAYTIAGRQGACRINSTVTRASARGAAGRPNQPIRHMPQYARALLPPLVCSLGSEKHLTYGC